MLLNVGELKKYLESIPDDTIFGAIIPGQKQIQVFAPKRMLLVDSGSIGYNSKILLINNMGTHWNEEWEKENHCKYLGYIDSSNYKLNLKS